MTPPPPPRLTARIRGTVAFICGARLLLRRVPTWPIERLHALLSRYERERMERYACEADRIRYANAHGILHNVLGKALDEDGAVLMIEAEALGRPRLAGRTDLSFSIAHSRDRLAIALADRTCGVDVEYSEAGESDEIVAIHCFHPDECAAIADCPKAQRTRRFYAVWTRKEAVLKVLGLGLTIDPAGFSVGANGEAARFDGNPHAPSIFSWALDPIDGFQMALALASPGQHCGQSPACERETLH